MEPVLAANAATGERNARGTTISQVPAGGFLRTTQSLARNQPADGAHAAMGRLTQGKRFRRSA